METLNEETLAMIGHKDKAPTVAEKLESLGFKSASAKIKQLTERKRKMAIAYEHYRFVTKEKVGAFNDRLKEKTWINSSNGYSDKEAMKYGWGTWQTLSFTSVGNYEEVPPDDVLQKMSEAVDRKCFDGFEVAHIISVTKVPDPILFGHILGCSDRFFVAQWDHDVKIEDILATNEG